MQSATPVPSQHVSEDGVDSDERSDTEEFSLSSADFQSSSTPASRETARGRTLPGAQMGAPFHMPPPPTYSPIKSPRGASTCTWDPHVWFPPGGGIVQQQGLGDGDEDAEEGDCSREGEAQKPVNS